MFVGLSSRRSMMICRAELIAAKSCDAELQNGFPRCGHVPACGGKLCNVCQEGT
jgi:hypothetical protein